MSLAILILTARRDESRSTLVIATIRASDFYKLEQICIGRITSTLVAGGENETSIRGAIVNKTFGFFFHLFRCSAQHELKRIDITLHADLLAITFLDLSNIHIAARRFLERFHHIYISFLANHFHHFARTSADMQMRIDTMLPANFCCLLDKRQIILTKVARTADAQTGCRTAQHNLVCSSHAG